MKTADVARGKLPYYPFSTINLYGSHPKIKGNSTSEIGILYRKQILPRTSGSRAQAFGVKHS